MSEMKDGSLLYRKHMSRGSQPPLSKPQPVMSHRGSSLQAGQLISECIGGHCRFFQNEKRKKTLILEMIDLQRLQVTKELT